MSQQNLEIEVTNRTPGKHLSREARRTKSTPAVVYGPKIKNTSINLGSKEAAKYSKHGYENAIFTLKSSDSGINGVKVLIKKVDVHPLTRNPIHMDFYALDMTKNIRVNVELRFEGKPLGAASGGVLQVISREVEVECLPTDIPEFITVDVSNLDLNDSVHASDLKSTDKMKIVSNAELTLAVVSKIEEEAAAPVAAAAATPEAAPAAGAAAPAAGGAAAPAKPAAGKKE